VLYREVERRLPATLPGHPSEHSGYGVNDPLVSLILVELLQHI